MSNLNYKSTETKMIGGKKIVRKVSIKNGKGFKTVSKYHKGRKLYTIKKHIHKDHINLIQKRKFIPGLFSYCVKCKTKKRIDGLDTKILQTSEKIHNKPDI